MRTWRATEHLRVSGIGLLLLVLAAGAAAEATDGPPAAETAPITLVEVTPSVVMARHDYGSNITCFALDGGLVFVDAGLSTEVAARFRRDMEQRFSKSTVALVLTHGHVDHFYGMGAFSDVPVVAPAETREVFESQLAAPITPEQIAGWAGVFPGFEETVKTAKPFLPTQWFEGETRVGPDGEILLRTTGGHSLGDAHAYFAKEGVIAAGDLLQTDRYPYFGDPATDLRAWIGALDSWAAMDVKKLCPGHGPAVDADYVPRVSAFFKETIAAVKKLKAEGVPVEQAVAHPSLPAGYWGEKPKPGWYDYCLAKLYESL
jgi:glyoxylase-like metal-dependent hydrolase (beta-lactamase superfamily II)